MGGIAGLRTFEPHRLKGYARRVMVGALRWMRSEGFDTTMLYGIRNFYPMFGYAEAFPNVSFSLAVRDAEKVVANECRVVGYRPEYLRAVIDIYHRTNEGRTGPTRRDPRYWVPWRKGLSYRVKAVCKVLLDNRRKVRGYFVFNGEELNPAILEVGYVEQGLIPVILRAAGRITWKNRLETIRMYLPEDHPFVEFCKPLGLSKEVTYRKDGGPMIRMINIFSTLEKLAPLLGSRLAGSGTLNLLTNLDCVGLVWSKGDVTVSAPRVGARSVRIPQWALGEMIYGYRNASDLKVCGVLKGSREAIYILDTAFPQTPHFHYTVDEF